MITSDELLKLASNTPLGDPRRKAMEDAALRIAQTNLAIYDLIDVIKDSTSAIAVVNAVRSFTTQT